MKLCPECGNDCIEYELRRWGMCISCRIPDLDSQETGEDK